ncbi:flagellin [Methylocystis parvus]|uniref:Flagellin n=1 Tax=Methylocystis parvus TaxID=134 RepID=A0A6B8M4P8_9HYPH|nr:flagellin [Methylocystis parvus]QGM97901.1 flagellin [Methylocystis parvus]WBK01787.1 flagellin [Methylocystis parvus OBBP]
MSSILVNPSAITALQSLRMTQSALNTTQKEISTGLKISSAADNASTWSIAETMKSDKGVLSTISDSLSGADAILNVAAGAVQSAITVVNSIKDAVTLAQQPGADQAKIATNLAALGEQLKSIVSSATLTNINAVDGSGAGTLSFIASYTDKNGAAASKVDTIDLTTKTLFKTGSTTSILQGAKATGSAALSDLTALTAADLGATVIADTLSNADKAIADLTDYASNIGATQMRVKQQNDFIKTMKDALTNGVSSLVDADMNEASTRLQALQTQQQLGVQSLAIANQNAQMILKLFQ